MKLKVVLFSLSLVLVLVACGGDEPSGDDLPMQNVSAPAATITLFDDPTNNGDATDAFVSFNRGSDETLIDEYRVFLVKTENSAAFSLSTAESVAAGRFLAVSPNGSNQEVTFNTGITDADGDAIAEDQPYTAFVLSVADGVNATLNRLSTGSASLTLAQTSIKITYMGNMGFVITDGDKQVIIDGLHGNLNGWYQVPPTAMTDLQAGRAPYGPSDIAMCTHAHGDHLSNAAVNSFLAANSGARFLAPPQARSGISSSRAESLNTALHESEIFIHNEVEVEVLHAHHFDQFGNDFSGVENYMYIVNIGGMKVLHMGDVRYSANNLSPFDLGAKDIDIVIIPTFNTLVSAANNTLIMDQISPDHIIATHLQTSTVVSTVQVAFPQADVFNTPLGFKRY